VAAGDGPRFLALAQAQCAFRDLSDRLSGKTPDLAILGLGTGLAPAPYMRLPPALRVPGTSGLVVMLSLVGCTGLVEDLPSERVEGPGGPGGSTTASLQTNGIARLTPTEYAFTIEDVLGLETAAVERMLTEPGATGFDTDTAAYTTSQLHVERFLEIARAVATAAPLNALIGDCDLGSDASGCVDAFLTSVGRRLIRRTPSAVEMAEYRDFHVSLDSQFSAEEKLRLVVQAMLMSPEFLYRPEVVDPTPEERAADWETATRLSYTLWASAPDDILLDLGEAGELRTPEAVAVQIRRMLADPRAERRVQDFFAQLLRLDQLASMEKDQDLAPGFSAARGDMRTEVAMFVDHAVWNGAGTLEELLTADYTFASRNLAATVGLPAPDTDWDRVSLEGTRRAGVLTTAGFLAVNGNIARASPVRRGLFVREVMLCQTVAPPPDDVDITIPELTPDMTNREQFAELTQEPACGGCHSFMNPIGFAFENFDAAGAFRAEQNGLPIDATGELTGTDVDGAFSDATDLARMLASSPSVHDCFVRHWFRYLCGRVEDADDDSIMRLLQQEFRDSGGRVPELLESIAVANADGELTRTEGN
jgi:hypothetical protein